MHLTREEAKRRGIAPKTWVDTGLTAGEVYAVVGDVRDVAGTLVGYYATEALAIAAADAADAATPGSRPAILRNPEA